MYNRCLVIVPHQDDETMAAGNLITLLRKNGTEVFVLYSTNGDWKYPADLRIKEAEEALRKLGYVDQDHILLLGYSDNYNNADHTNFFYSENEPVTSKSGHCMTYGAYGIDDYAYRKTGKHSPYCRNAFVNDLKMVIEDIRADLIVCTDFDEHPDHRILTLAFDEAMGRILRERDDYHPAVLKSFAYCDAYTAVNDFYTRELQETVRPCVGATDKYKFDMIDSFIYSWNSRIHVYAPKESVSRSLFFNRKAKALRCHKSQYAALVCERVINADEVYWQRRTDSLSYQAEISVTSGKGERLNDFHLYNCDEIDSEIIVFNHDLWSPDDEKKEAVFSWEIPQTISSCQIYGNYVSSGRILKMSLVFDNGCEIITDALPKQGRPLMIKFEEQKDIHSCTLKILETEGTGWGISECEFYNTDSALTLPVSHRKHTDENVMLEKCINTSYLTAVRGKKLAERIYRFARYRGIKGLKEKLHGEGRR